MLNNNDNIIIRFCEVLSVDDDTNGLRIKVRLPYEDGDIMNDEDLPYVFPLLPKFLHINPKIGECVMVILQNQGESKSNRFFIGPVISQPYFNNFDPFDFSSRSLFKGSVYNKPMPDCRMNPENNGTLPDREDIAIVGRKNTDLLLKDNEIRIRCGFKKDADGIPLNTLLYNKADMAYIQMKYKHLTDNKNDDFNSTINIVADRINLLSHDSLSNYNLCDENELITDEELKKILKDSHPLVYGDKLVVFLKNLLRIFKNHTHPFVMDSPVLTQNDKDSLSEDLDKILCNNIKIN